MNRVAALLGRRSILNSLLLGRRPFIPFRTSPSALRSFFATEAEKESKSSESEVTVEQGSGGEERKLATRGRRRARTGILSPFFDDDLFRAFSLLPTSLSTPMMRDPFFSDVIP